MIRPTFRDQLLGPFVVLSESDWTFRDWACEGGIDDVVDTYRLGRSNRIGMSCEPLARLQIVGGDDEETLAAREGCFKRSRVVEIALARLDSFPARSASLSGVREIAMTGPAPA